MTKTLIFKFAMIMSLIGAINASLPPPTCIERAPFNLRKTDTVLAIYDAIRQGTAWYEYRLAYMIENLHTLPPSQVDAAVDHFMEVFCEDPYFKGFIGITGTGELFTNRSQVRELYKGYALSPGVHVPFNVKAYNEIVAIPPDSQVNDGSVYGNITAFNEHIMRSTDANNNVNFWMVNGHYQNEWRISPEGDLCISGFTDAFLVINQLTHVPILEIPWNLDI